MKFVVTPDFDSDNTYPPEVTLKERSDGSVAIMLEAPSREIVISKDDWETILRAAR